MDPVARFGEPVRISPFLKFCRWSALLLGITYGLSRSNLLQRRADRFKATRDLRKAARLKFEAEEEVRIAKQSMIDLSNIIGAEV